MTEQPVERADLRAALEAIDNETTLPPRPTQYRRGWADASAAAATRLRRALAASPEPGLDVELLARAMATYAPGYYTYPPSGSPKEGIPYKLNALYDAGLLAAEYVRLSPAASPSEPKP